MKSLGIVISDYIEKQDIKNLMIGLLDKLDAYSMITITMSSDKLVVLDDEFIDKAIKKNVSVRIIGDYFNNPELRSLVKKLESISGDSYLNIFIDYSIEKEFIYGVSPFLSTISIKNFSWKDLNLEQELRDRIPTSGIIPYDLLIFIGESFNEFPARLKNTIVRIYSNTKKALESI